MPKPKKIPPPGDPVKGSPSKYYFVQMMTRDIELVDAVLDLLDNCVDGALRSRSPKAAQNDSLAGYYAKITIDSDKFVIEDNCGGIPWDIAHEYAFRMGRPEKVRDSAEGTIGVFGIGMKRAIFKMGRSCVVRTHHPKDAYRVTVPSTWFTAPDEESWNFPSKPEKPFSKKFGTRIEITEFDADTKLAFSRGSTFLRDFAAKVGESYSYIMAKGFEVHLNIHGQTPTVERKEMRLCFEEDGDGAKIRPYMYEAHIGGVEVFMAVGFRTPLDGESGKDDDGGFRARDAGWTVVCNDRIVLCNDRTFKTGWGIPPVPSFHNQFSCIAGVVEFRSRDTKKLPVTTTKRGIDTGKDVYEFVRARMQEGVRMFTKNTNEWKGFEDKIRKRFDRAAFLDLPALKSRARRLEFTKLAGQFVQRQLKPALPQRTAEEPSERRISFTRKVAEISRVSEYLFDTPSTPPAEVGEKCFEIMLKQAKK